MVNLIYFSRQGGVYASQIVLLLCSPQWVGYKHVLLFLPGQSAVSFFLCLGHVVIDIFSSLVATKCPARFKLRSTSLMFLSSDRCCPELTPRLKCLSRLQRSGRFRVGENFAFVFCGRKAFGGNIIKPGYLIRFVPFPFCYTPKQLQPAEGRF